MRDVTICNGRLRGTRPLLALALVGFWLCAGSARAQDGPEPLVVAVPRGVTSVKVGKSGVLPVYLEVASGWHVFGADPLVEGVKGLRVTLTAPTGVTVFPVKLPAPRRVNMPALGKEGNVYEGRLSLSICVTVGPKAPVGIQQVQGVVQYQACSDAACRLPKKLKFTVPIHVMK